MPTDAREELAELTHAVRDLLAFEAELGGEGLPAPDPDVLPPPPRAAVQSERAVPLAAADVAADAPALGPSSDADPTAEPGPAGADKRVRLQQLADAAAVCTACVLHSQRKQAVFARGNPDAELVFVGEGPGQEEDRKGAPFVGPAGQLLDRMIAAMGFEREAVYVCNVVKCRPPDNRTPRPEEAIACARFLVPQLELVAPKVIVALGRCAAENLGVAQAMGPWRGRWGQWRGIPVLPTYHPAYLLRSPEQKRVVWEDLQLVLKRFGWQPAPRR